MTEKCAAHVRSLERKRIAIIDYELALPRLDRFIDGP